jgi:hypothetical protein
MFMPRMVWSGINNETIPLALALLLSVLTRWNVITMRMARAAGMQIPPLYSGALRYIEEDYTSEHPEDWLDWVEVNQQGGGDCEDLAAYRAAELIVNGETARPVFHRVLLPDGRTLFHIFIERANGVLEDPSRLLGMPG